MAEYALGDARRPFDLYDTEELRIQKSEEERRQLAAVVEKWPPAVDGYCFVSQKEVDAVVQLRQSLSDLEEDCAWASLNVKDVRILLCFCRARKLEVKKAEKMWRETHAWRKHVEPVQALRGYVLPLVLDKYGTGGQFGLDREGCPVFYDPVANIDPVSLLRNTTDDELLESEMMKLEMLQALLDRRVVETGTLHSGCTIVIDIRNLGRHHLNKAGLHALKLILEQNDKNYPERAKRILVINAPMIFGLIWGARLPAWLAGRPETDGRTDGRVAQASCSTSSTL
jgi:hypothetical protein